MKKFAFTCGDINGIGPEIVLKTLNRVYESGNKFIFICPKDVFENTARDIAPLFDFKIQKKNMSFENPELIDILDIGKTSQSIGNASKNSGLISYNAIKESFNLASTNKVDAIITAPISKYALELAGISYPGHTEMYAEWTGQNHFVMMFLSKRMNCALLTIHEPIRKVPGLLKKKLINDKIEVIINSLKKDFGIWDPRIAVLGLNPHAGENGRIGKEEIDNIIPVLKEPSYSGFISGPFVPDAFFANKLFKKFDMVIGSPAV